MNIYAKIAGNHLESLATYTPEDFEALNLDPKAYRQIDWDPNDLDLYYYDVEQDAIVKRQKLSITVNKAVIEDDGQDSAHIIIESVVPVPVTIIYSSKGIEESILYTQEPVDGKIEFDVRSELLGAIKLFINHPPFSKEFILIDVV